MLFFKLIYEKTLYTPYRQETFVEKNPRVRQQNVINFINPVKDIYWNWVAKNNPVHCCNQLIYLRSIFTCTFCHLTIFYSYLKPMTPPPRIPEIYTIHLYLLKSFDNWFQYFFVHNKFCGCANKKCTDLSKCRFLCCYFFLHELTLYSVDCLNLWSTITTKTANIVI